MFVFLKILLFLFRPLIWIIILFVVALLAKYENRKKTFFKAGVIALLVFSNPFIIRALIQGYETKPVQLGPDEKYSTGIVLGGFVSYNGADDRGYFNSASDRFIQTLSLYKTGHIQNIIIAAGNGYITKHGFKEADYIKQRLVEVGVPAEVIFSDPDSRNTKENAINSKKIIDSVHLTGPYLLISSAIHLPRAQLAFTKQGVPTRLYPCDFSSKNIGNNFLSDYILPSAAALNDWDNFIKELLGVAVYKVS